MNRHLWTVTLAATIACGPQPRERDAAAAQSAAPAAAPSEGAAPVQTGPEVQRSRADRSAPLREMKPAPRPAGPPREAPRPRPLPRPAQDLGATPPPEAPLPFAFAGPAPAIPATSASFEGIGDGFTGPQGTFNVGAAPPDTNGAVGPNHYVQLVNTDLAVFGKTGTVLYGPVPINTLWSGFGGGCQTNNDGDPIVLYDRVADRWILSQFSVTNGPPYLECIAVSQTGDPTGSYHRYAFSFTQFPDYPKIAVWPDAYYVTYNMFTSSTGGFVGAKVCALDRAKMLAGQAATQQCFNTSTSFGGLLASDLEGPRLPPAGAPNLVVALGATATTLAWWKFHVDWTTPASSTFTVPSTIAIPTYSPLCGATSCVPQLGTTNRLDALSDRLMHRLSYRNLGAYESLVVNHSVVAGTGGGVRWYELRTPSTPTLNQSGTYAPDPGYRWMGSIAQDAVGDLGLGYSLSNSSMKPAIRYTGRAWNATAGTMDQGEGTIVNGAGAQTTYVDKNGNVLPLDRWGDYSAMTVDPSDDCTFWYTNEYIPADGAFNWKTRIASFRLPNCPPKMAASAPATATVHSAVTVTFTAQDQLGNTLGWYTGPASLTSSDGGATFPSSVTFASGVATASVTFVTVGSRTVTATDPVDPTRLTATAAVTVSPGPPVSLALSGLPASTTAGTALSPAVTAKDAWGNVATGYAGTGNVSSDDGQATLPSTVTFASGVATVPVTLKTAGARSVTVTDSVNGSLTVTGSVQVGPAAAASYAISGLPASATAGAALAGTVTASDAYGNVATGYSGPANVTTDDARATVPSTIPFASGVGSLPATLETAGARSVTVTDAANAALTATASVQVGHAAPAAYAVTLPAAPTAGAAVDLAVAAQDAFGNAATAYAGTGRVTSSDAQAALPADLVFASGAASGKITFRTAGPQTVTVTDLAQPSITGSSSATISAPDTGGGSGGGCGCGSAAPGDLAGLLVGLAALWRGGRRRARARAERRQPQG